MPDGAEISKLEKKVSRYYWNSKWKICFNLRKIQNFIKKSGASVRIKQKSTNSLNAFLKYKGRT